MPAYLINSVSRRIAGNNGRDAVACDRCLERHESTTIHHKAICYGYQWLCRHCALCLGFTGNK